MHKERHHLARQHLMTAGLEEISNGTQKQRQRVRQEHRKAIQRTIQQRRWRHAVNHQTWQELHVAMPKRDSAMIPAIQSTTGEDRISDHPIGTNQLKEIMAGQH